MLKNIPMVSVESGMKNFRMKIAPIVIYCTANIAPFLNLAHFKYMDKNKSTFI